MMTNLGGLLPDDITCEMPLAVAVATVIAAGDNNVKSMNILKMLNVKNIKL